MVGVSLLALDPSRRFAAAGDDMRVPAGAGALDRIASVPWREIPRVASSGGGPPMPRVASSGARAAIERVESSGWGWAIERVESSGWAIERVESSGSRLPEMVRVASSGRWGAPIFFV